MSGQPIVLAAVDLDNQARRVIAHALRLAAGCPCRPMVAHVVDYTSGFESDQIPLLSPRQVRVDMARHARAWLVGLVHDLGASAASVDIRVETGLARETILVLAEEIQPRYLVVGRSAWGRLGTCAGLEKRLAARTGGELVVVGGADDGAGAGLVRRWLGRRSLR